MGILIDLVGNACVAITDRIYLKGALQRSNGVLQ